MIVVDMESSGLDPLINSLLSIGAVDFEKPANQFYGECRIWPGAHIDKESLAVNGFKKDEIISDSKQTEKDLLNSFLKWTESCEELTIAGQNPSTDRDFLKAAAGRYHINWTFAFRIIDLHSIVYFHMMKKGIKPPVINKHSGLSLDKILNYVGMPDEPKPHNGLRGAKLEAEAFSRLIYKKPLLDEYSQYPLPESL